MKIKALFLTFALALATAGLAQTPQTQQDINPSTINAQWVNGVGPGYRPQNGVGLTVKIGPGEALCAGTPTIYTGGTLPLTGNALNYAYVDGGTCQPAVNTSGFPATAKPIATVLTSWNSIYKLDDMRTVFSVQSTSGTGSLNVETNSTPNTSQTDLNFTNPAPFNGLSFAFSNPSGGIETLGITGTLNSSGLTNTAVTPGSYTNANITVNAQGQVTAAANGTSGTLSGTGTANTIAKFASASSVANSTLTDDGSNPTRAPNGLNTGTGGNYEEFTNDVSGTANEKLACVTGTVDGSGRPTIATCPAGSTSGLVGIVEQGAGTTGTALVCWTLNCPALFTNTSTAGHVAIIDPVTPGELQDTGTNTSTAGFQPFSVLKANTGAGTASPVDMSGLLAQNPTGGGNGSKGTALEVNGAATKGTANFQN